MLKFDSGIYTQHTINDIVLQSMLVVSIQFIHALLVFLTRYESCSYNCFILDHFTCHSYSGTAEQLIAHPCRMFCIYVLQMPRRLFRCSQGRVPVPSVPGSSEVVVLDQRWSIELLR